jgi:PAS domain-containing protein
MFGDEELAPEQNLIEFLRALGGQIGLFLAHFEIAVTLSNADRQFTLVADASKDAVLTINEDSTGVVCQSRCVRFAGISTELRSDGISPR